MIICWGIHARFKQIADDLASKPCVKTEDNSNSKDKKPKFTMSALTTVQTDPRKPLPKQRNITSSSNATTLISPVEGVAQPTSTYTITLSGLISCVLHGNMNVTIQYPKPDGNTVAGTSLPPSLPCLFCPKAVDADNQHDGGETEKDVQVIAEDATMNDVFVDENGIEYGGSGEAEETDVSGPPTCGSDTKVASTRVDEGPNPGVDGQKSLDPEQPAIFGSVNESMNDAFFDENGIQYEGSGDDEGAQTRGHESTTKSIHVETDGEPRLEDDNDDTDSVRQPDTLEWGEEPGHSEWYDPDSKKCLEENFDDEIGDTRDAERSGGQVEISAGEDMSPSANVEENGQIEFSAGDEEVGEYFEDHEVEKPLMSWAATLPDSDYEEDADERIPWVTGHIQESEQEERDKSTDEREEAHDTAMHHDMEEPSGIDNEEVPNVGHHQQTTQDAPASKFQELDEPHGDAIHMKVDNVKAEYLRTKDTTTRNCAVEATLSTEDAISQDDNKPQGIHKYRDLAPIDQDQVGSPQAKDHLDQSGISTAAPEESSDEQPRLNVPQTMSLPYRTKPSNDDFSTTYNSPIKEPAVETSAEPRYSVAIEGGEDMRTDFPSLNVDENKEYEDSEENGTPKVECAHVKEYSVPIEDGVGLGYVFPFLNANTEAVSQDDLNAPDTESQAPDDWSDMKIGGEDEKVVVAPPGGKVGVKAVEDLMDGMHHHEDAEDGTEHGAMEKEGVAVAAQDALVMNTQGSASPVMSVAAPQHTHDAAISPKTDDNATATGPTPLSEIPPNTDKPKLSRCPMTKHTRSSSSTGSLVGAETNIGGAVKVGGRRRTLKKRASGLGQRLSGKQGDKKKKRG